MFILKTESGTHSPNMWANVAAQQLFPLDHMEADPRYLAAKRFQVDIEELLVPLFANAIQSAKYSLETDGDAVYDLPYEPNAQAIPAIRKIQAAASETSFHEHFDNEEVKRVMQAVLCSHFATIHSVELQHYAKTSDSPKARDWLQSHHPHDGV